MSFLNNGRAKTGNPMPAQRAPYQGASFEAVILDPETEPKGKIKMSSDHEAAQVISGAFSGLKRWEEARRAQGISDLTNEEFAVAGTFAETRLDTKSLSIPTNPNEPHLPLLIRGLSGYAQMIELERVINIGDIEALNRRHEIATKLVGQCEVVQADLNNPQV